MPKALQSQKSKETITENLICMRSIRASQLASLSGISYVTGEAQAAIPEQTSAKWQTSLDTGDNTEPSTGTRLNLKAVTPGSV